MRKIVVTLLASLSFACLLQAQDVFYGLRLDPSVTWLGVNSETYKSGGSSLGFNAGMVVERYFSSNYALVSGISVNSIGGKIEFTDNDSLFFINRKDMQAKDQLNIRVNYLDIPLGMKFTSTSVTKLTYYGEVGVNALIKIRGIVKADSEEKLSNDEAKELFQVFNIAYNLGLGMEFEMPGGTRMMLGLKYTDYLLNLIDSPFDRVSINSVSLRTSIFF